MVEKEKKVEKISKEEAKRILQEKSLQLVLLNQELKKIEDQYALIDQSIANFELTKQNLDEIKNIKDKEILAQIAEGIFLKARASEEGKVLINVGKGVVLEKSVDEAKEILDAKIEEFSLLKSILSNEAKKILDEIKFIEEEVKRITS
ncbi:MAG: prefoldin subunit alpha [Candidatus Pacearchaeota archaeon]